MVAFCNHVKKVRAQPLQINNLAPDLKLALHQSIVAVEIHDELSIGAARHGKYIGDPGIHGVPCFHDARVFQAVPQLAVVCDVVFDWLQGFGSIVNHFARHVAESRENFINIKVLFVGPARKRQPLSVREVQWSGQQQQIAQVHHLAASERK